MMPDWSPITSSCQILSDGRLTQSVVAYLLVGMEVDTVDWTVGLVNFLAGEIPHLEVPDPG